MCANWVWGSEERIDGVDSKKSALKITNNFVIFDILRPYENFRLAIQNFQMGKWDQKLIKLLN